MYTAKTTITHHQNMIACSRFVHNFCHKSLKIPAYMQLLAQRCQRFSHIPIHFSRIAKHLIRRLQALG